eukprot:CAMPEP_0206410568 /NCGR_PEP_ID=MMETSP0294-20121207/32675_1 /ASSEMBLY_ACC=CAM_ASM_000327 /TAXON_ID=39354 /ORGANISM="Heterosigma akashiwo, Strain CCMP2393" /LENGTH=308 /DNA_ID=CAMNT_0053870949 /DNA_START=63 /DNA_END=990 /DNA_ORIENTATION=+
MATQLDMSLDDIIAKKTKSIKKGTSAKGKMGVGRKPVVVKKAKPTIKSRQTATRPKNQGRASKSVVVGNVFMRKAGGALVVGGLQDDGGGGNAGTTVEVSNLNYDIMSEDINELFATCGPLLSAEVDYDASGRSEGGATVVFQRRADALEAVKKFNNRTLDGTAMTVKIAQGGTANGASSARGRGSLAGSKASLFGTALGQVGAYSAPASRGRGGAGVRGGGGKASLFGTALGQATSSGTRPANVRGRGAVKAAGGGKASLFGSALSQVTGGGRGSKGKRRSAAAMMEMDAGNVKGRGGINTGLRSSR